MEEQQNNSSSSLKVIIAILAILLVGSLVYIYKITNDAKTVQTELTKTVTEKEYKKVLYYFFVEPFLNLKKFFCNLLYYLRIF